MSTLVSTRSPLFYQSVRGGLPFIADLRDYSGNIFFVDSNGGGGDTTGYGHHPDKAHLTIDYAIGRCTANQGDVVLVMPGHSETLTTAITCDVAGIAIIGMGRGTVRPQLTINANIDGIDVTAANVKIVNLYFNEGTAAHTAAINVAAAFCEIRDCHFDCGANDLESITVAAAGNDLLVEGCEFRVTANGPDAGIEIEGTSARAVIRNNHFDGGSGTNGWDAGAINSGQAHTLCLVKDNTFSFGPAIIFSGAATGLIVGNLMGEGTLGSMLDPGSCMCMGNMEQDAVDEAGVPSPRTMNPAGLGDGAIPAAVLGADAITAAKIADNAFSEEHFDDAAVQYLALGIGPITKTQDMTADPDDLFDVTGKVLLTHVSGEVTTVIPSACTLQLKIKTTGEALCAATTIDTDAQYTMYLLTGDTGAALNGGDAPTTRVAQSSGTPVTPLVVGVGSGSCTIEGDLDAAEASGAIKWTLYYIPLEASAAVAAAA